MWKTLRLKGEGEGTIVHWFCHSWAVCPGVSHVCALRLIFPIFKVIRSVLLEGASGKIRKERGGQSSWG